VNALEWVHTVVTAALVVGGTLLTLYVKERLKSIAKEESDRILAALREQHERSLAESRHQHERVLAEFRHEHERTLAALHADHQRRLREFGLFTDKQHQVYGALYRRVRQAADQFGSFFLIFQGPDFRRFTPAMIDAYAKRKGLLPDVVADARAAAERGEREAAAQLMSDLDYEVRRRDAMRAYQRARNVEALYELYLSDAVREKLHLVRVAISRLSTYVEDGRAVAKGREAKEAVDQAVMALFSTMREEIRRGESAREVATTVHDDTRQIPDKTVQPKLHAQPVTDSGFE
jgi:hypothetical protein